jgi:hypothetical protein
LVCVHTEFYGYNEIFLLLTDSGCAEGAFHHKVV